jgi:hypothetical protein
MTLCAQFDCYGTMMEQEDELGRFLQCSRCGARALAPGEGTPTILVAPEKIVSERKTFRPSARSLPPVGGARLQKLRVRRPTKTATTATGVETTTATTTAVASPVSSPASVASAAAVMRVEEPSSSRVAEGALQDDVERGYENLLMVAARLQHLVNEIKETVARSRRALRGRVSREATTQRRTYPMCSRCGRQFTWSRQYTGSFKKRIPAVCVDRDDCDRRLEQARREG